MQGWHCYGNFLPLPSMSNDELVTFIERASPYMARFLAIYRHAETDIEIVKSERGAALRRQMEEVGARARVIAARRCGDRWKR